MKRTPWVLAIGLLAVACGDDDDDDGGAQPGTGLAGIFSGGGRTGGTLGPGAGGDPQPAPPAGQVTGDCREVCDRVVRCLPEGGCPNFGRLSPELVEQSRRGCQAEVCGRPLSEDELAQVRGATCREITSAVLASDATLASFCRQSAASEAECDAFWDLLLPCIDAAGEERPSVETQRLTCLWGDAIRCTLQEAEAQGCRAVASCQHLFPSDGD